MQPKDIISTLLTFVTSFSVKIREQASCMVMAGRTAYMPEFEDKKLCRKEYHLLWLLVWIQLFRDQFLWQWSAAPSVTHWYKTSIWAYITVTKWTHSGLWKPVWRTGFSAGPEASTPLPANEWPQICKPQIRASLTSPVTESTDTSPQFQPPFSQGILQKRRLGNHSRDSQYLLPRFLSNWLPW